MNKGRSEAQAAAIALRGEAQALSNLLAARSGQASDAFAVIAAIGGQVTAPRFTDYAGSAQAVMAIDTLLNAMVADGRVTYGAAAGIRADLNRAYGAVRAPESYRPADFRTALTSATSAIGRLR